MNSSNVPDLISVEEAHQRILSFVQLQPIETCPLHEGLGRYLAEPILSHRPIPAFDNSAVDGFAVLMEDVQTIPCAQPVSGCVLAGDGLPSPITPETCVQVMTGAPIPPNADAIVMVEWTEALPNGNLQINRAPKQGQNIRRAGDDVSEGKEVLGKGALMTPAAIGMAATLGAATLNLFRKPRIAIISTGNELVEAGKPIQYGQIYDANAPALAAYATQAGAEVVCQIHVRDDLPEMLRVFAQLPAADIWLISGGVSMGTHDFVRQALDCLGWMPEFWRIRQRPGKPLAFGTLGKTLIFGLPGNPVSSAVTFDQYVRPVLRAMQGISAPFRPQYTAKLTTSVPKSAGLHHFIRGKLSTDASGALHVTPTGAQGSHRFSSVLFADALIHLPEDWTAASAGTLVHIERLNDV